MNTAIGYRMAGYYGRLVTLGFKTRPSSLIQTTAYLYCSKGRRNVSCVLSISCIGRFSNFDSVFFFFLFNYRVAPGGRVSGRPGHAFLKHPTSVKRAAPMKYRVDRIVLFRAERP